MHELTWLKELVPQAPGIVAAVVIVAFFLRYLGQRDVWLKETLETIHADHMDSRRKSHELIEKCSGALMQNSRACDELVKVNEKMTDLLQESMRGS